MQDARIQDARSKIPMIVVGSRDFGMDSCILNGLNLAFDNDYRR